MTKMLVALSHGTYGGVYYAANANYADLATQPTWAKYATTGLANLNIKRMQNDVYTPYSDIYLQLTNDSVYHYNGATWDLSIDLATAITTSGLGTSAPNPCRMGYVVVDRATAGTVYTGLTTEFCVLSTVIDGLCLDFSAIILEDCTVSHSKERHQACLSLYRDTSLYPLLRIMTRLRVLERCIILNHYFTMSSQVQYK